MKAQGKKTYLNLIELLGNALVRSAVAGLKI